MSRIGKMPIAVPAGVDVTINGTTVTAKGPKGELSGTYSELVSISLNENEIVVAPVEESSAANAQHGLVRTLINNMVVGVSEGFEKRLEFIGVGYRVQLKGKDLTMNVGYSHPVEYTCPENITFEVPDNTHIIVRGINKQQVGQVAAEIRAKRPPEPYKGKGIRYEGEYVRRKLGKAAG